LIFSNILLLGCRKGVNMVFVYNKRFW